jgi:UPF0755 protein
MSIESGELTINNNSRKKVFYFISLSFLFIFLTIYLFVFSPVNKEDKIINISSGESLNLVIKKLKNENIIQNEFIFKIIVYTISKDRKIIKGDYKFDKNISIFSVANQLVKGVHNIEPIKITLKEGITKNEVISIFENNFKNFEKDKFIKDDRMKEGYIFPDTYIIFPSTNTEEIIEEISNNFNEKIKSIKNIENNKKIIDEIIIMASLLEKEAKGKDDISLISGILWKRINIGMMIQADAAPETYKNKGLPKEPISNPGLLSIKAALDPVWSQYLYYLHDKTGQVHFAESYKEHINNINKYLK